MPRVFSAFAIASLVALSGCMTAGEGNVITAGVKIASGQMTTLTPHEIQVLATTAQDLVPEAPQNISLTDAQASAVVDFLVLNEVNTLDELAMLIEQAEDDPDSIEIPEGAIQLFDSGAFEAAAEG